MSVSDAIDGFCNEGWTFVQSSRDNYNEYLETIKLLEPDQFTIDIHVDSLLVFPSGTHFYEHECYHNGSIYLQDKASCLPAFLLNPPPGSTILDMCAAPGMKTTQLAAIIEDKGTIYSVERDQRRFQALTKMIEISQATCIKTINRDVTTITSEQCPDVEYVLVDPSCTGSGMQDRRPEVLEQDENIAYRLEKLAGFQIAILKHALHNFPKAKKIIYSTCSIYPEENEEVVERALNSTKKYKLVNLKKLLKHQWINVGSSKYKVGKHCIYSYMESDLINGFFIAMFERVDNEEARCEENVETENGQIDDENTWDAENKKEKKKRQNSGGLEMDLSEKNKIKNNRDIEENDSQPQNRKEKKRKPEKIEKKLLLENVSIKKKKKKRDVEVSIENESQQVDGKNHKLETVNTENDEFKIKKIKKKEVEPEADSTEVIEKVKKKKKKQDIVENDFQDSKNHKSETVNTENIIVMENDVIKENKKKKINFESEANSARVNEKLKRKKKDNEKNDFQERMDNDNHKSETINTEDKILLENDMFKKKKKKEVKSEEDTADVNKKLKKKKNKCELETVSFSEVNNEIILDNNSIKKKKKKKRYIESETENNTEINYENDSESIINNKKRKKAKIST